MKDLKLVVTGDLRPTCGSAQSHDEAKRGDFTPPEAP